MVIIFAARFKQQDTDITLRAQPISQHAAGGTGANDHIIEDLLAHRRPATASK